MSICLRTVRKALEIHPVPKAGIFCYTPAKGFYLS